MTKITENHIEETVPQYTFLPKLISGELRIDATQTDFKEAI